MEFRNLTPFPSLAYAGLDTDGARYHHVVMRLTYDLQQQDNGEYRMELAEVQQPLVMQDSCYDAVNVSSVRVESDLAPYKPKCDVIVSNARAYAPEGRAYRKFQCCVQVGDTAKTLCVTGPRAWQWRLLRWALLDPEPVTSVDLRYENAYGGHGFVESEGLGEPPFNEVYARNPIGKGWVHPDDPRLKHLKSIPAPQIESPDAPVGRFGVELLPEGFGVIGRSWTPRLGLAGTYDENWKKTIWPGLPKDFDFAYWNGAHPDLQIPYPEPDAEITLYRLTPEGKVHTRLPGHRAFVLCRFASGIIVPLQTPLDTLIIDPEALQIVLVHRARIPENLNVRVLEARFEQNPAAPLVRFQQPATEAS